MDGFPDKEEDEQMVISQGIVMLVTGVLGVVICGGGLCMLPRIFRRQREQLLKKIKMQDMEWKENEKGKGE